MKLICRQSELNHALSLASRAVSARPTQPVLGNVLLKASGSDLILTGFDLAIGVQTSIPADVLNEGAITLPAKLLGDIISRLPDQEITLECDDEWQTVITTESGNYQIRGLAADEFPELPTVEGEPLVFPLADLVEGISRTQFVVSTDETKQVLTGVHISQDGDRLEYAATDGHRLSVLKQTANTENKFAITIPARALRELERLATGDDDQISLLVDDAQAVFLIGGRRLTCRTLGGAYPAYNQLIPAQFSRTITADRKRLIAALERVGVLADQKNNLVKLSTVFSTGRLIVAVEAQDLGNGKESFAADIGGMPGDFDIAFNIKYLLDGLKNLPGNEVKISMNEANQPVILTPLGESLMTYLVMPVQIVR